MEGRPKQAEKIFWHKLHPEIDSQRVQIKSVGEMSKEGAKLDYSFMECPVCFGIMDAEILLCSQGHSICKSCFEMDLKTCPECRSPFTNQRNYKLEDLIKQAKIVYDFVDNMETVQCSFAETGCEVRENAMLIKKHEDSCPFRKIPCYFAKDGCTESTEKNKIAVHEANCAFRRIKCHYARNGCDAIPMINEVEEHEEFCEYRKVLHPDFNQNLLRCHQCKSYLITPPILIFPNNEFGCSQCSARIEDGTFKYLQLMAEIDQVVKFPCTFKKNGCKTIVNLSTSTLHEKSCKFRDVRCKLTKCEWIGCLTNLKTHIELKHPDSIYLNKFKENSFKSKIHIEDPQTFKCYLVCDEDILLFRMYTRENKISMNVLLVGSYERSFKIKYEISVGKLKRSAFCTSDSYLEELYIFKEDRMIEIEEGTFLREFQDGEQSIQISIYIQ